MSVAVQRWLREPLPQFLLLGLALFVAITTSGCGTPVRACAPIASS